MHAPIGACSSSTSTTPPPFRTVNYADDGPVLTVSTRLRQAWVSSPSLITSTNQTLPLPPSPSTAQDGDTDTTPFDITTILRAVGSASPADLRRLRNSDNEELHTPLRDAVYYNWNHVFWDVARFLGEVAVGAGHLHPPAEGVFAMGWKAGEERVFETNILLAPTFVEEGVRVRFDVGNRAGSGIVFDATGVRGVYNETVVHWIRKGERIKLCLEGEMKGSRCGVAAVFVYGKLCDCVQEKVSGSEKDSGK
ncbi:hypothetical protein B0J12DRAFT_696576 [Macrophomina phaseolina]|uniref:Uncharacterized protein n=1 Tax=Macrophomina phaseolina TaxID=35725 RepID=A0ABQ8GKH0_9PEZI|nr:hypothetical protein B0J12DRAFT_696576 [Macrophomina phaseolina]